MIRAGRALTWVLIALPVLGCLALVVAMASASPEPQAWRATLREPMLAWTAAELLGFDETPRVLGFRLAHLGFLELPGVDFDTLPLLGWVLAGLVVWLVHRRVVRAGGFVGAVAGVLLATWCFSPSFGANWLLAERFRIFVPPLCFALALALLDGRARWRLRFAVALALAQLAIFVDRTGCLVWIAALPAVCVTVSRHDRGRMLGWVALWCVWGNVGSLVCHGGAVRLRDPAGILGQLLDAPGATAAAWLRTSGQGLPSLLPGADTSLVAGALLQGALAVAVAVLVVRRRRPGVLAAAAPWLGFVVFGEGVALLATHWFPGLGLPPAFLREFTWAGFMLPLGVLGLVGLHWGGALPRLARVGLVALLVLAAAEWSPGLSRLAAQHRLLRQGEAQLAFAEVATAEMPRGIPPPILGAESVTQLRDRGLLAPIHRAAALDLGGIDVAGATVPFGEFLQINAATALGWVAPEGEHCLTDVVLLTRQRPGAPETIFKIALPLLTVAAERKPWRAELTGIDAFVEGERLRALAFDARRGTAVPLDRTFVFAEGELRPSGGEAR